MHYDVAVEKIKELDNLYQPFAIYCDRGAGEKYQNVVQYKKQHGDNIMNKWILEAEKWFKNNFRKN